MKLFPKIKVRYPQVFFKGISRLKTERKILYLSFDDGPTPEITEKVLSLLAKHNAKASFFCTGVNAEKHPEILQKIKDEGHCLGNHSYSHFNAFKVKSKVWLEDAFKKSPVADSELFRPPYGRFYPWQYYSLRKKYKLVFWDVISYDYRQDYKTEIITDIIKKHTRKGSVIVFHDSKKAEKNMLPALEFTLEYFSKEGFEFAKL